MISIKQNTSISSFPPELPAGRGNRLLPDLRNLGVCLRILVLVNVMALLAAILQSADFTDTLGRLAELSAAVQPLLLTSLLLLYGLSPLLRRLPYVWATT